MLYSTSDAPPVAGKLNLPEQATPFVGRGEELDELTALLNDPNTRLITILAPCGMGKTRLALEAARTQSGYYADGVFFVPLAPLSVASAVVTTIAEHIGFSFYGETTPPQQLINFLSDRSLLLVLDNFEHLLDGAPLVADLIQAAPRVRVLTTSRERLGLHGETLYTLRGLNFPTRETSEGALDYDAVKLFLHSAQRLRPDFVLQAHDYDYLERICRLTAGMPLGIELAAGWIDVLTLEQIATELQRGIDILETDLRDIPERQRSVRATFESTWERLTDEEQRIFMRLSVFRGGFTVEAARVVASADVRALRKLINKALVQVLPEGRHGIHELLRQFGGEKLTASGQQAQLQASHADYFADFMAQRKQDIRTDRQLEALELIDPEFENVRVAWLHTVDQQVWAQFPKFLHSLWFYLDVRTRGQEGVELLEYAVKALQSTPSSDMTELALGRVLARLGWFYNDVGFIEKRAVACNEAIRILQEQNSPEDLLAALNEKHNGTDGRDQYEEILSLSREGFDIAQAIGDKSWEGRLRLFAGFLCHAQEDFAEAFQLAEEALVLFESLGDGWCLMTTYHLLGAIKVDSHEDEAAKQWFDKMQPLAEAFGHAWSRAGLYVSQGKIALHERNYAAARLGLRKGVKLAWDAGYQWVMPYLLIYFAQLFTGENDLERAVQTLATVHKQLPSVQADAITRTLRNELETKLGPVRFAAAWARGQERELSTLVAELLAEPANGLEGSPKVLKTGSPGQSVNQLLMEPLSPRELEVLGLIAEGLSNPEIAQKLYLSVGTIKVHTRNIYGKLGVNNRTEAVVQAQKLKLL